MGISRITLEYTWKCKACGAINLGRDMNCQGCGKVKEDELYIKPGDPDHAPEVTDAALLAIANGGDNWKCQYCGGEVRNAFGKCIQNCGGDRPASPGDDSWSCEHCHCRVRNAKGQCDQCGGEKTAPRPSLAGYGDLQRLVDDQDDINRLRRSSSRGKVIVLAVGIVAILAGLIAICVYLFAETDVRVDVKNVGWTCRADLIHRTLHSGEGWEKDEPSGAFNASCTTRQNGTKEVNFRDCRPHQGTPYNCKPHDCEPCTVSCPESKNGFGSCTKSCATCYESCTDTVYDTCHDDVPNMENWCTYDYYTSAVIKTLNAAGADTKVQCPELTAHGPDDSVSINESYHVKFANRTDSWDYTPANRGDLARFQVGDRWHLAVNRVGGVRVIDRN